MREVGFEILSPVIESWEQLRLMKNYEEEAGMLLYEHLFTLHPEVAKLFGLPGNNIPEMKQSKRFVMQAKYMIQMLDTSLQMLGPDIELLTEINHELGERHVKYGVTPAMYRFMGEAIIFTMKEMLGDKFDADMQKAWEVVYAELSGDILSTYPNNKD
uniref:Globin domain-containing protein n=1 Tax=Amphora coffeiformis TaxID=265554 RepID=A0A7S3L8Z0_9STRA|mmetsp:Transcript_3266/g.6544  ORF Transcript_3266/g.6544 Transcript_3266/m.6544 type:complete len:158 (-) Transcript_3266:29-502(-)|eukprot:scaffold4990_cov176-Amphora_coffeaeformis.AAC.2